MSFTNAPVTRTLVVGLVSSSVAASLFDLKHYFYILVDTHIWKYHQTWRALIFQLCYTNSSEVLFAAMTLYNMRVVERMWGSRKYAVCRFPRTQSPRSARHTNVEQCDSPSSSSPAC